MPYETLLSEGRIVEHAFTDVDLENLIGMAERDLRDALIDQLSDDNRFGLAYDGIRTAATAVMAAEGYRTVSVGGQHQAVFMFLEAAAGGRWAADVPYFQAARKKRNQASYDVLGAVTATERAELAKIAQSFVADVRQWLLDEGHIASPGDKD